MGKHVLRLLKFALCYPGWHSYYAERETLNAIRRLVKLGLIEVNKFKQFRIVQTPDTIIEPQHKGNFAP